MSSTHHGLIILSNPALCPRVHADSQRVSVVICTTSILAALAWRERPGWEDADRAWVLPYALRPAGWAGGVKGVLGWRCVWKKTYVSILIRVSLDCYYDDPQHAPRHYCHVMRRGIVFCCVLYS